VLVENHGHLVEKDQLLKTVWPDSLGSVAPPSQA
jgi:DNA-binding winged helix-turn-helix (wHTH) protein